MPIDRRVFLAGLTQLASVPEVAQARLVALPGAGNVCLGLNGLSYYAGFYPLLNVWKLAAPVQVVANGIDHFSSTPPGSPHSPWKNYLDENGDLVSPLPDGVTEIRRVFFAGIAPESEIPDRAGQRWVLKWNGTAQRVIISGATHIIRTGNRLEWTWINSTHNMWVVFSGFIRNDPPRDIRLCMMEHEKLLDAGEVFHPDWLQIVRQGSGVIRFMDWQSTNFNRSTLRAGDIPTVAHCSYGGIHRTRF